MPGMQDSDIERIAGWLVERGLAGISEYELLKGFSELCRETGLDLCRSLAFIDTLHPVYEGRAFFWRHDEIGRASGRASVCQYGWISVVAVELIKKNYIIRRVLYRA